MPRPYAAPHLVIMCHKPGAPMSFTIGTDFDKATQWAKRLDQEIPFLRAWLRSWNAQHVLDLACGTGRHCLALAREGFAMTGVDASPAMLEEARRHAMDESIPCGFIQADMRHGWEVEAQDAILCVGNSLCLLPDWQAVRDTLATIHAQLAPAGGIILHVLNYQRLAQPEHAFFPLKTDLEEGRARRHFLKMIEVKGDEARVHMIRMEEESPGKWVRRVSSDRLTVLRAPDLMHELVLAGFGEVQVYGSLKGETYHSNSHDVVLCARKQKTAPLPGRHECDGKPSGTASPPREGELD
jgi:SAM-dependent methyltransferase